MQKGTLGHPCEPPAQNAEVFRAVRHEGDMLCDLYFRVFVDLVNEARRYAFPATFPSACANYLTAMLELMRRYGFVEQYVQQIMTMIEEFPHLYHDRRQFRNALQSSLDTYFATHPLD